MIICRTPFRISFFGGGTDYPGWYRQHGGAVLAASIDKYCYLTCRFLPPFYRSGVFPPSAEARRLTALLVRNPLHEFRYLGRCRLALAVSNDEGDHVIARGKALQLHLTARLEQPIPIRSPG